MFCYVLYALLAMVCLFVIYILLVAALASKKRTVTSEVRKNVNEETLNVYVNKLSKMLKCKTVYTDNKEYEKEFENFREVL